VGAIGVTALAAMAANLSKITAFQPCSARPRA
jgi:hypothetical protein